MTYGPPIPLRPPRNKHRWQPAAGGCQRCSECRIARYLSDGKVTGWRDRMDHWNTSPIPQCQ